MSRCHWFALWLSVALLPGCGPRLDKEDLGEVVFEIPDVPGAKQPYPLPEFAQEKPAENANGSATTPSQP